MSNIIPNQYQSIIRYDEQWHVVICLQCNAGVAKRSFKRHMQGIHKMKHKEYHHLLQLISDLPVVEKPQTFPPLPNQSTPIVGLKILSGYKCTQCDEYLSQNKHTVAKHAFQNHNVDQIPVQSRY